MKSKYKCKLCGTDCGYDPGIGDFCPNPKCKNIDGIVGRNPDECFELKDS